jgi:hypothetical protein
MCKAQQPKQPEETLALALCPLAMSSGARVPVRSRTPRGSVGAVETSEVAALRTALAAEQARYVAIEARWLSAYNAVVRDARELAALARGAGAGGEVVDDWFVPPPTPAEPEPEPAE